MIQCTRCRHRVGVSDYIAQCHGYRPAVHTLNHTCPACGNVNVIRIDPDFIVLGFLTPDGDGFTILADREVEGISAAYYDDRVEIHFGDRTWIIPFQSDDSGGAS